MKKNMFREYLREFLYDNNISQLELSEKLGDSQQVISDFLRKEGNPQANTRRKYFKKLRGFEDYHTKKVKEEESLTKELIKRKLIKNLGLNKDESKKPIEISDINSKSGKVNMNFLELKKFRENLGISREDLAKMLGISINTLNTWEYRTNTIPNKNIKKIRDIINIHTDKITDNEENLESQISNYTLNDLPKINYQILMEQKKTNELLIKLLNKLS